MSRVNMDKVNAAIEYADNHRDEFPRRLYPKPCDHCGFVMQVGFDPNRYPITILCVRCAIDNGTQYWRNAR